MKKTVALILSFIIAFGSIVAVSAVSRDTEYPIELNHNFLGVKESSGIGYVYYSPVKDENDTTTYPLFIYMPGVGESTGLEKALYGGIGNLADEEYQNNVTGVKGAYIMQMVGSNLRSSSANHTAIKHFVDSNPNVDKTRIYVSGWCVGAPTAINLVTSYSDYYAGLCIYSPFAIVFHGRLSHLKNTRIWVFGSITDLLVFFPLTLLAYSSAVMSANDNRNVRLTTCAFAPFKGPAVSHYTWKLVYGDGDEQSRKGLVGLKTKDGTGAKTELTSILGWMSEWTTQGEYVAPSESDIENNGEPIAEENESEQQMSFFPGLSAEEPAA